MNEYDTVRAAIQSSGATTPADRKLVYRDLIETLHRKIAETQPRFRSVLAERLRALRQATKEFERDYLDEALRPEGPKVDKTPPDPSVSTLFRLAPRAHSLGRVRTIVALTLRFLRHLSRIGPAAAVWIFIEPIIQMAVIVGIYSLIGATSIMDMETLPFVVLGVGAWFMFRIIVVRTANMAVEPNLVLIPRIRMIDVLVSRALAYAILYTWSLCFFLILIELTGRGVEIDSILGVVASWFAVFLFAIGTGLIFRGLISYVPVLVRFTPWIVRLFFYTGGIVFVSEQLPDFLAKWMLLNPLFDATQSLRSAFFTTYQSTESSLIYSYVVSIALIAVGLMVQAGRLSKH